jgi:WD40 repeat protein
LATGSSIERLAVPQGKRLIVVRSESGETAAYGLDTLERVEDAEAEAVFAPLAGDWSGYGRPARPMAIDSTGAFSVTAREGGGLEVWVVRRRELWAELMPQGSEVSTATVTADGRIAVSAQFDHDVKVWDLTQYEPRPARTHRGHVESITLLPEDGLVVVGHRELPGAEAEVVVWDLGEDLPVELEAGDRRLDAIEDADDARRNAGDQLAEVATALEAQGAVPDMRLAAATPDGRLALLTTAPRYYKGSDTEKHWLLHVWDVEAHAIVATLRGHHGMVFSAAISDDGTRVASASEDATVKLWRIPEGTCLATFTGDSEMVTVAIVPDGSLIVAGERGGSVHLLEVV